MNELEVSSFGLGETGFTIKISLLEDNDFDGLEKYFFAKKILVEANGEIFSCVWDGKRETEAKERGEFPLVRRFVPSNKSVFYDLFLILLQGKNLFLPSQLSFFVNKK